MATDDRCEQRFLLLLFVAVLVLMLFAAGRDSDFWMLGVLPVALSGYSCFAKDILSFVRDGAEGVDGERSSASSGEGGQEEVVVRCTATGEITHGREEFCQLFSVQTDETAPDNLFHHVDDRGELADQLSGLHPDDPLVTLQCDIRTSGDEQLRQRWTVGAFFNARGEVMEYQVTARNVDRRQWSAARLGRLIENAPDMIVLYDTSFRHIYCNRAVEHHFGVSRDFFLGRTFSDLRQEPHYGHYRETARTMERTLQTCLREGQPQELQVELPFAERGRYFDTRLVPQFDPAGEVVAIQVIARDITEQVWAKEELRQRAREHQAVLNGTQSAMCLVRVIDEDTFRYVRNNKMHEEVTGFSSAEIREKDFAEVVGEDNAAIIARHYRACARRKAVVTYEETLSLPTGEKTWRTTLTPLINSSGCVTHIVGMAHDITRLKEQENQLRRLVRDQNIILSSVDTHIWYLRDPHTYGGANEVHAQFWGLDVGDLEGRPLSETREEEDLRACLAANREVFCTAKTYRGQEWVTDGAGEKRFMDVTKTPHINEWGEVEYVICSANDITEQRELEENLRQREQQFLALAENSPDLITRVDRNLRRVYTNPRVKEYLGVERDDAVGKNNEELGISPPMSQEWEAAVSRVFSSGESVETELTSEHNGVSRFFHTRLAPEFSPDGRVESVVSATREITRLKKAERQLHHSEKRLQNVLALIPDMISIQDPEMNIVYSNWNGFGAVPEEDRVLGRKCYRTYRDRDSICPDCRAVRALHTGEVVREEVELPTGWFEVRAIPVRGDDGEVELLIEWVRDITDQKEREQDLLYRKNLLQGILDGISDVVAIQDTDHRIEQYNRAGYELLGMTHEEVQGRRCYELLGRESECPECATREALRTGEFQQIARYVPELELYLDWRSNPVFDENGELVRVVEQLRDITEEKKMQQKMRYMSFHDRLTGLYNRRFLEQEMDRLDSDRQFPLSLIMADVNGLKLVNETYGHDTGDRMLARVAGILQDSCRSDDIIGRWGGDEFVVVLPRTDATQAKGIAHRIRRATGGTYIDELPISVVVGVGVKEDADQSMMQVLSDAENDMYKNKLTASSSQKSVIVDAFLRMLRENSFETEEHTRRMTDLATRIGERIGLSESEMHRLVLLVRLHDIGKTSVSQDILTKEESLTPEEWEAVKEHPEVGYRIARSTEEFSHVAEEILTHHERWDGTGYPQGLQGEEIPLLARIVAIADAYEVMINGRPYSTTKSHEEVVAELRRCAGSQFDPQLIPEAVECIEGSADE